MNPFDRAGSLSSDTLRLRDSVSFKQGTAVLRCLSVPVYPALSLTCILHHLSACTLGQAPNSLPGIPGSRCQLCVRSLHIDSQLSLLEPHVRAPINDTHPHNLKHRPHAPRRSKSFCANHTTSTNSTYATKPFSGLVSVSRYTDPQNFST